MTRFKELRRIEAAIENEDESELLWSSNYCKMRINLPVNKKQIQVWKNRKDKVDKVLQYLKNISK